MDFVLEEIKCHNYAINVLFVGKSYIGKTSLINRIINDFFFASIPATLTVDKIGNTLKLI